MQLYNFSNNISIRLPMCQSVDKTPITTFNNNINYTKDYSEKNKIGNGDYNNTRIEYLCAKEDFKTFSIEEIRMNDYINGKISFFDKWSNLNFNQNNEKQNPFCINSSNNNSINNFTFSNNSNNNNINNNNVTK